MLLYASLSLIPESLAPPVFVPGHLFIADAIILFFLLLSGFHFGARIYNYSSETKLKEGASARRVIIIGAGDAGASVLKELLDTPRSGIVPVALVDDDLASKKGTLICGVPVAGSIANLSDVLFSYQRVRSADLHSECNAGAAPPNSRNLSEVRRAGSDSSLLSRSFDLSRLQSRFA